MKRQLILKLFQNGQTLISGDSRVPKTTWTGPKVRWPGHPTEPKVRVDFPPFTGNLWFVCAVNFNVHLWHAQTINFHEWKMEIDCTGIMFTILCREVVLYLRQRSILCAQKKGPIGALFSCPLYRSCPYFRGSSYQRCKSNKGAVHSQRG